MTLTPNSTDDIYTLWTTFQALAGQDLTHSAPNGAAASPDWTRNTIDIARALTVTHRIVYPHNRGNTRRIIARTGPSELHDALLRAVLTDRYVWHDDPTGERTYETP